MNALYYRDPYCREFDAEVVRCTPGKKGFEVVLTDTAFYPEGGGQPADHGTLNDVKVTDVRERNDEIVHFTEEALPEGSTVHGVICWQRRFDHMQNHSGEHIVSGLIHKHFGYENVGFHMGPEETLIDFDGMLDEEQIRMIEHEANELIWRNIATKVYFPGAEELAATDYRSKKELHGTIRLVEFPDADLCACCGTHVERTGEIGLIKITDSEKHKNGTRLHLLCGMRALRDYGKKNEETWNTAHLLSAKPYEISAHVEKLLDENGRKQKQISVLTGEILNFRASQLPEHQKLLLDFETGLDTVRLREFANTLVESRDAETAAVFCGQDQLWSYVIVSRRADLKAVSAELNRRLNGRGGGSRQMIQGTCTADRETITAAVTELLDC